MIYTITLNPAIDYFITLDETLLVDEVNRGSHEIYKAGGKGLNVSKILSVMNIPSKAIAVLGGFTGQYIQDSFEEDPNIEMIPIPVDGMNRINMKANYGKKALCVNGSGPVANNCTVQFLLDEIAKINADDIVIISGSVMHGFPDDFVTALAQAVHQRNAKVVIDMEQITMEQLKECRPYLIKPNLYEFQLLFENDEINESNIDEYLKKANEIGIENILVSLGKDGAVLSNAHGIFRLDQPRTVLVNKVGAGDAMLASFIGKLSQGYSSEEALQWGGAAGNATASKIEDITMRDIEGYLPQMKVSKNNSI
ncbi:1-phosphofructokinase family hexose kinase [Bulleidia sp. HCP3S3_F2]|uniref:1-phosphofructokinase family hexose kinase n=1 Tax=unclassified Bulleidia TaxID=2704656 RepID=UPI003F8AB0AC